MIWFKLASVLLWLSDVFIAASQPTMRFARWCSSRATACIAKGRDAAGIVKRPEDMDILPGEPGDSPVGTVMTISGEGAVFTPRAPRTARERRYLREISAHRAGNPQGPKSRKTQ